MSSSVLKDSSLVYTLAALLAIMSGAVNAIAFSKFGTFVANHTGTVTQVGLRFAGGVQQDPLVAVKLLGSFISGCALCGIIIPVSRPTFTVGDKIYSFVFLLQAALMFATCQFQDADFGKYIGCIACGLMNSITTSWSGGPMRSTHSTGPATEVGLTIGRMLSLLLRGQVKSDAFTADYKKFLLNAVLVFGFMGGAFGGSKLHTSLQANALLVPASTSAVLAVLNLVFPVGKNGKKAE